MVLTLLLLPITLYASVCGARQDFSPWYGEADGDAFYMDDFEATDCVREPIISMSRVLKDLGRFGRTIFSADALGILGPFVPFWGAACTLDSRVHARYYCFLHHKNKRNCSKTTLDIAETLVGLSIGGLSFCSFAVRNRCLQRTAQLYAVTLPITWAVKKGLKQIKWHCNKRPRDEKFGHSKVYYGGFPSGHMLEMTYATVLFGLAIGPQFAIPLGLSTAVIATAFVKSNRHFLSQLVAGAAIGALCGYAGYRAVSYQELYDRVEWSIVPEKEPSGIAVRASYSF